MQNSDIENEFELFALAKEELSKSDFFELEAGVYATETIRWYLGYKGRPITRQACLEDPEIELWFTLRSDV